ncbi:epidermal retinol dehydrogenase 2 [Exaiptasia diaphana]|uniref:Epidermal retinol dehydrogenase 2 n=1 Tax=Exaiptasia diaphana TaxID=2652724 RepID=A0A913WWV3_EXADI|nr:epidermal retinol dehydrogenase 2 [Exaiptasia diaphana]KXJ27631.1 Epidermal retinol dehydrogenase 2 [Exaiptasia diaphana]
MANVLLEFVQTLFIVLLETLKSVFRFFIPAAKKDVSGEIVFISGAGSGLGKLMAFKFAQLGAIVVCSDINEKANDATVEELKSQGFNSHGYKCDVSKREDIYRVADLVKNDVGDVTILVNNAGIVSGKKFLETEDWMIQKTFEVNTMAHFWTTKAFLPSMISKNHGHIVSIASSAGLTGVNGLCDYCSSKFGAVGFDESLRMELYALGKTDVHTTAICPFYINTGMFDGVQTRFPWILPILEPEWAVDKMMDAIRRNQPIIYLPRILYFFFFLKGFLPCATFFTLSDFFGASNSMDNFKGRAKNQ